MFEIASFFTSFGREILHVSEYTGISVGVIIALIVLAYLDPGARNFAIRAAILAMLGYCVLLFGYHTGTYDKSQEWAAANAQAQKAAENRDKEAAESAEKKYGPIIAQRDQMVADLQQKVTDYENKSHGCSLGDDALFLRGKPRHAWRPAGGGRPLRLTPVRDNPQKGAAPAGDGAK